MYIGCMQLCCVLHALCGVGSVTGSACIQDALPWKKKINHSLGLSMAVYFCLLIFGIFLESIFLYALFCDLKCYLCSQISEENVHNVIAADLFGY